MQSTRVLQRRAAGLMLGALLASTLVCQAGGADVAGYYAAQIRAATAGTTVQLPPGTLALGDLEVPAGVSIKGAGYELTTIDASGHTNGLVCKGKGTATLSDFTVRHAGETALVLDGATGVTVTRVAARQGSIGFMLRQATGCGLRNVIAADNRMGVVFNGCTSASLVNATLAGNSATGLLVTGSKDVTVFNNVVAFSQLGARVGAGNTNLALDHNLYVCYYAGSLASGPVNPARKRVESWRDYSGYDQHSLMLPVAFAAVADGNYRPVLPLSWAPDRATTSDWGVAELNGIKAPERDIDGAVRVGGIDLGAYEASFAVTRPADGKFSVKSGAGVTSAGLFTKSGTSVSTLFQNLPLQKGSYSYWLPSRDWQGGTLVAGDYELRTVESKLKLEYVAAAGNGDLASSKQAGAGAEIRASLDPQAAAFDAKGRFILAQSGFESGVHVRSFTPDLGAVNWSIPGGGNTAGVTVDEKGRVYVLRRPGSLLRIDGESGKGVLFANGSMEKGYDKVWSEISGLAFLEGRLFAADPKANKVIMLGGETLDPVGTVDVPAPAWPAADIGTGRVWVISGETELLSLDESGQIRERATPVAKPTLLAANNGRLAVYSAATNQVTLFDCRSPTVLRKQRVVGAGGDSYGRIQPDRFWAPRALALDALGALAVIDPPRTIVFNPDGTVRRQFMGMWGQGISWGLFAGDERPHFFNIGAGWDIILDPKTQTWESGSRWKSLFTDKAKDGKPVGFSSMYVFPCGGKSWGAFQGGGALVLAEMTADGMIRPAVRYSRNDKSELCEQRDANGDGVVDEKDAPVPVPGADGKPITAGGIIDDGRALGGGVDFQPDGALVIPHRGGVSITPVREDRGVAAYDFANRRFVPATVAGKPTYQSPYDFKTEEKVSLAEDMSRFADGSFAAAVTTKTGAGPDLCTEHANGTSMAGFDAAGALRWFYPLNPPGLKMGFWGILTIGGVTFAGRGANCEYETMDRDGLGTGLLGTPYAMAWCGMWLDNHRQSQGFTAADGTPYLIIGDYAFQTYHWLRLTGHDRILRQAQKVTVKPATAAALQAAMPQPVPDWPVPGVPTLKIRALKKPLPIDGDPEKWRQLGIQPLLLTPDLASGGPAGTSAVIRLAYHQENLYVLAIKFDDVLTSFQREIGKHYLQDGLEMAINSYPSGFKYNITRLVGQGDVVYRDTWRAGWGHPEYNQMLPPETAPRVIKVLDNAASIADRKLLEAAYGVDMSACKVMLMEFMIPRAAMTPMENKEMEVDFAPGKSFRLGFMLNDNDTPGADAMNPVVWPITYGTFERTDRGALAVFE